jgi:CubicO group peptidase (beta-lactamase class C family)
MRNAIGRTATRFALGAAALSVLVGCASCGWGLTEVAHTPIERDDWRVSTPEAEGLDSSLVDRLYSRASRLVSTQGVLVIKNGALVAEAYFNGGSIDQATLVMSVTKSVTSALTGIAISQGYLGGVDDRMIDYFPEFRDQLSDGRKNRITLRHLLQMRAGYPWEESSDELFNALYDGLRPRHAVDFPLDRDPGVAMEYSNLSAHLLGIIVARATGIDLRTYAEENLFGPIGVEIGDWGQLWEGYHGAAGDLSLTARAMARFGQLYLDRGVYEGETIVPEEWVQQSFVPYSTDAWHSRVGSNYNDFSYGYLWWSARAGSRTFWFAWGHGGQVIALVPDQGIVVVVKADPLFGQHGGGPWRLERQNLNLAADFIASLP